MPLTPANDDPNRKAELDRRLFEPDSFGANERRADALAKKVASENGEDSNAAKKAAAQKVADEAKAAADLAAEEAAEATKKARAKGATADDKAAAKAASERAVEAANASNAAAEVVASL